MTFSLNVISQQKDVSVEKSIYGIQTGILGVWIHSEIKLNSKIALRTEVGLDSGIFGGSYYSHTNFILFPTLTVEPRFYYNLNKRNKKSKTIFRNSGNFLTLKMNYTPDIFVISNLKNISIAPSISIIPKWAIKRTFGKHFTFETGAGLGYRKYFLKNTSKNSKEAVLDLHVRVGYTF